MYYETYEMAIKAIPTLHFKQMRDGFCSGTVKWTLKHDFINILF